MRRPEFQLAISLGLCALAGGCTPRHAATTQKLPPSILADVEPGSVGEGFAARAQARDAEAKKAGSGRDVRQVDLTEEDLRGAPALPISDGSREAADPNAAAGPIPTARAAHSSPPPHVPSETGPGVFPPAAANGGSPILLPERHGMPRAEEILGAAPASVERSSDRIGVMTRRLEAIDPRLVDEFLAATRKATVADNLEPVLAVWQATIDHRERSPGRVSGGNDDMETELTPIPNGLPRRSITSVETSRGEPARGEPARGDLDATPTAAVPVETAKLPEPPVASARGEGANGAYEPVRLTYDAKQKSSLDAKGRDSDGEKLELVPNGARDDLSARLLELAGRMESSEPPREEDRPRWQVYSRLLYLMAEDNRRALKPIATADSIDRKFWRGMIWSIHQSFDAKSLPRPEARAAEAANSLEEALAALRQRADLEITTPVLCSKVESFGTYQEFSEYLFRPGQSMVVYWELKNFASVETKEGFRTRTAWAFEVLDAKGTRKYQFGRDFGDDLCRNQRQDYFNVVKFTLPEEIAPGEYTLKVISTDKTTDKVAERQIRFTVK